MKNWYASVRKMNVKTGFLEMKDRIEAGSCEGIVLDGTAYTSSSDRIAVICHMRSSLLFLIALPLLSFAQGGVRIALYNYEKLPHGISQAFGIGYDHDLNERLSYLITARLVFGGLADGFSVDYRSAYHFNDNSSTSFYMGPTLGVRRSTYEEGATMLPVGLRMGVRGGLERWYGDLFAGFQFMPILSGYYYEEGDYTVKRTTSLPATIYVGVDVGFGWDK